MEYWNAMHSTRTVLSSCRLWTGCDVVQAWVEVPSACSPAKLEMATKPVLVTEPVKVFRLLETVALGSEAAISAKEEVVVRLSLLNV